MGMCIKANIKVEVSFPADSVWSKDTTVEQIIKQALDSFTRKVRNINSPSVQENIKRDSYHMKVIGEPRVEIIVIEPNQTKQA